MSLFDVGTMTELLNRSLTGGVVILAVLALRLMMRRFPRKYVCILWLAAFGRLLFSIPVPAASSLFPAAEPLPTGRCGGGWKARHGHGPPAVHRTGAGGFGCQ